MEVCEPVVDDDFVEKEEEEDAEEDDICAAVVVVVVAGASTIKFHPFTATAATVIEVETAVVTVL
jgi:hypothetical protein